MPGAFPVGTPLLFALFLAGFFEVNAMIRKCLSCSLLVSLALLACGVRLDRLAAAEDESLSGYWKVVVTRSGGSTSDYYIDLKQDKDKLSGVFNSPRSGSYNFEGGTCIEKKLKLEIPRKMGEKTSVYAIEATLAAPGKFEGKLSIDGKESGTVVMTLQKSPIAGTWNVVANVQGQELSAKLQIWEEESGLKGKGSNQQGSVEIKSIAFDGKKLALEIPAKMNDKEITVLLSATLKDANTLGGEWKVKDTDLGGEWKATREAAAASKAPKDAGEFSGKWYGVAESPTQGRIGCEVELKAEDGALKGKIKLSDAEIELKDCKVEGKKVSFTLEYPDASGKVQVKVEGELKGEAIQGKWTAETGDTGEWSARKPTSL
jgi:hypothetical protein